MHPLFINQEVSRFHNVEGILSIIRSSYFRTKEEPKMNKTLSFDINPGQINNKTTHLKY